MTQIELKIGERSTYFFAGNIRVSKKDVVPVVVDLSTLDRGTLKGLHRGVQTKAITIVSGLEVFTKVYEDSLAKTAAVETVQVLSTPEVTEESSTEAEVVSEKEESEVSEDAVAPKTRQTRTKKTTTAATTEEEK